MGINLWIHHFSRFQGDDLPCDPSSLMNPRNYLFSFGLAFSYCKCWRFLFIEINKRFLFIEINERFLFIETEAINLQFSFDIILLFLIIFLGINDIE